MSGERFIDTNVLIYAFSDDTAKAARAETILASGGIVSVQVLNEFTHVCRRKLGLDWPETGERLSVIRTLVSDVVPLNIAVHEKAVDIARDHQFSVYDALIIAAALNAGCRHLITEDMQHGRLIDGLNIENPFLSGLHDA